MGASRDADALSPSDEDGDIGDLLNKSLTRMTDRVRVLIDEFEEFAQEGWDWSLPGKSRHTEDSADIGVCLMPCFEDGVLVHPEVIMTTETRMKWFHAQQWSQSMLMAQRETLHTRKLIKSFEEYSRH